MPPASFSIRITDLCVDPHSGYIGASNAEYANAAQSCILSTPGMAGQLGQTKLLQTHSQNPSHFRNPVSALRGSNIPASTPI